ncbi:uncharacterized protein Z518_00381 [Rhinocladiella mackenziei CBS 650.93]|uniref:Uncharacterized protein n=1 Tax=Rhinocladiella mackenziei CBS 650.93 TaxID=1442369 RepID=A0A0D2G3V0_9EURO|nr:uncharacterized protein Z518_00381 [Rhinocladiella mackenziei CBS 650.93]KIX09302.1 hypothetical protein Z518_00381 [Rhinocladiella mackenziei CBS 650.93]
MNASNQEAGQGPKVIPTIQEVESWNDEQLLEWIQRTQPDLLRNYMDFLTFKAKRINGSTFLEYAEDPDIMETHLRVGVRIGLASLALEVILQCKKGGGNEDEMTQLAAEANKRRKAIKDMITQMNDSSGQHSNFVDPLPEAIDKLSDPTSNYTFDFPYIGTMPERFKEPGIAKGKWLYMGRRIFKSLLRRINNTQERYWLRGTQDLGRPHLLAALVCYLAAQNERVVYLPDCQALFDDPVPYVRTAMLFAWANDFTTQKTIMGLHTQDQIRIFLKSQKDVIFVVDQMNALESSGFGDGETARQLRRWVIGFTFSNKAIFNCLEDSTDDLEELNHQDPNRMVWVHPRFTATEITEWWEAA